MGGFQTCSRDAASVNVADSSGTCQTISRVLEKAGLSAVESYENVRQLFNRANQKLRPSCPQPLFRGERSEYPDGAHPGAPCHLHVLGRVTHIHARGRIQFHLPQSQAERLGMGLLAQRISAANTGGEKFRQAKFAQLANDAVSVATGNETKMMVAS